MYSLVSAPVLGFDLTRMSGGPATAGVLLRALCLTEPELAILADHVLDTGLRGELWLDVDAASTARPPIATLANAAIVDLGSEDAVAERRAAALRAIELAPIGTVDALLRCLRYDVMAWTWTGTGPSARQHHTAALATALLCDAAVAAYLREALPARTRQRLGGAWVAALRRLPVPDPVNLGPQHLAVTSLLDRLGSLSGRDADRLSTAADDARRQGGLAWATAVHSASWAAHLSDRVRTAAAGQLLLVLALDHGVVPVADRAGGVWNLLSGAVQALVVRDMLDATTTHRLLTPVIAALGPTWLS